MSCITEILKLKGDKDVLVPYGNWIAVEGGGKYKDHEYLIVLNTNGYRCGYVAIPPQHKYSQTSEVDYSFPGFAGQKDYDYDSLDIECHGGLTFMSPNHHLKHLLPIQCTDMWIGFDCGHYLDRCDVQKFKEYFGEEEHEKKEPFFSTMDHSDAGLHQTIKGYNYVEQECHSIIEQLIKAA